MTKFAATKSIVMHGIEKLRQFLLNNWQYWIIILFGLIATAGIWGDLDSFLMGDDVCFHITRLRGTVKALLDGQIFPQVDPVSIGGYGYAYNIFYGPLITWIAAVMRIVISSWPIIINLICIALLLISGILTYRMMYKVSQNKILSVLVAVIYMLTPYHLINVYLRMALGEFVAMTAMPLLMLGLYQLVNHEKHAVMNIIIAATTIVLANNVAIIMAVIMAAIYLICNLKQVLKWSTIQKMLLAGLGILGLTACFILPLAEAKITGSYGVFDSYYQDNYFGLGAEYLNLTRIPLSSSIAFQFGESFTTLENVGIDLVAVIGLIGFWFVRTKIQNQSERKFVTSLYVISIIALSLTTTLVSWQYIPNILHVVQFPWRFLAILALTGSIVSGYVIYYLIRGAKIYQQKILIVILGLLMLLPVANMIVLHYDRHFEAFNEMYLVGNGAQGWQAEYAPIQLLCKDETPGSDQKDCSRFVLIDKLEERGDNIKILNGRAAISDYAKNGTNVKFHLNTKSDTEIELPLIWYAGYQAKSGKKTFKVSPSEELGLVAVKVPADFDSEIEVSFGLSLATKIGLLISGLTALICVSCIILSRPKIKPKVQRLLNQQRLKWKTCFNKVRHKQ